MKIKISNFKVKVERVNIYNPFKNTKIERIRLKKKRCL